MSLFSSLSVSASGMAAQRARTDVLVENLANAETTRTPEGGPYRRKDVVFRTVEAGSAFGSLLNRELDLFARMDPTQTGVEVAETLLDQRDPERRYIPGHPDADAGGYVSFPNVHPAEEMVDLMSASRGFQANVSAMTAVKDMLHRSIDLLR
jgi:flagellar basal-body rod protein FlgC